MAYTVLVDYISITFDPMIQKWCRVYRNACLKMKLLSNLKWASKISIYIVQNLHLRLHGTIKKELNLSQVDYLESAFRITHASQKICYGGEGWGPRKKAVREYRSVEILVVFWILNKRLAFSLQSTEFLYKMYTVASGVSILRLFCSELFIFHPSSI